MHVLNRGRVLVGTAPELTPAQPPTHGDKAPTPGHNVRKCSGRRSIYKIRVGALENSRFYTLVRTPGSRSRRGTHTSRSPPHARRGAWRVSSLIPALAGDQSQEPEQVPGPVSSVPRTLPPLLFLLGAFGARCLHSPFSCSCVARVF